MYLKMILWAEHLNDLRTLNICARTHTTLQQQFYNRSINVYVIYVIV